MNPHIWPPSDAPPPLSRTVGHSSWSASEILQWVLTGGSIGDIPGDFTVADASTIITSVTATRPYYFTTAAGSFVHGRNVFEIARQAGLPWRWNERAIQCMALFGHTVGMDTLHPEIFRAPASSVITAEGITELPYWKTAFRGSAAVGDALDAFCNSLSDIQGDHPLISMSAGFDSRAILAGALASGRQPELLTMGFSDTTDRIIAETISDRYGLRLHVVELKAADYLADGLTIARLTSGTKTAANWHTYLYAKAAGQIDHTMHLVGSNGEFARSYYLDRGLVAARIADSIPGLIGAYFAARVAKRHRHFAQVPVVSRASIARTAAFAERLSRGPRATMNRLDYFYATQRLRHFIGQGQELLAAHSPVGSPFNDARFISAASRLNRSKKLGSQFHRDLIGRLTPSLLKIPAEGHKQMSATAPRHYWRNNHHGTSYSPYAQLIESPAVSDLIIESDLDEFASRRDREALVAERNVASLDLLLTLHFAKLAATQA